ncbi:MAG TPA: hypothetical protein VFP48_08290, partial [Steroidobacteraceae bacterium]|nr:hypothetical protein [Steroidobacteraceae bacterium]
VALLGGCASDGDYWDGGGGGVSTSVSVGVGYGSYYGPGWYGGYYEPYPPVVVVPPEGRPDRPAQGGERPTTLPSDVGATKPAPAGAAPRVQTAPSRPANVQRPTSRPSPRPAPRPMPRMGRR